MQMFLDDKYLMRANETVADYEIRMESYHDTDGLRWEQIATIANSETGASFSEAHYRKAYKKRKVLEELSEIMSGDEKEVDEMPTSGIDFNAARSYVADEDEEASPEALCGKTEKTDRYPDWMGDAVDKQPLSPERIEKIRRAAVYGTDTSNAAQAFRQDIRFERFYRTIGAKLQRISNPDFLPLRERHTGNGGFKPTEYVVTLADLHAGAKFVSENNKYSYEEINRRFELLQDRLIDIIEDKEINTINILSLGDLVQGLLRISDVRLNEDSVTDAVVYVARLYAGLLRNLSKYCNIKFYMVCYSNHDQLRPLGSKANQLPAEDIGKIVYAYLTDVLADNPRIEIIGDVSKDYIEFYIGRFFCHATHGHLVREVEKYNNDVSCRNRVQYDYVFLGHTHSAKEIINAEGDNYDVETLVSGSLVGSDPYADKLFVGSKASVQVYGFNQKYGHVETLKIILN